MPGLRGPWEPLHCVLLVLAVMRSFTVKVRERRPQCLCEIVVGRPIVGHSLVLPSLGKCSQWLKEPLLEVAGMEGPQFVSQ